MTLRSFVQRAGLSSRTVNITQGRLRDNIWQLSWPLMISQGLSFFPGIYDAYWLGRLGPYALAAATLAMSLRITMISVLMALSGAAGAVVARYVGARDAERANQAVTQAVILFAVAAGSLGVVGLVFAEPLLILVGAQGDLLAPTAAYARAIFAGLIAMELVPSIGNMLNCAGNPQLSLQMNLVALFSFLVLEPLLIWLGLGVTGAGLALVLANTAAMCYGLYLLASGRAAVRIERRYLRPDWEMIRRILRIAVPGIAQRGLPNLANTVLMRFLAGFGAAPLAVFSLFGRIAMLLLIPAGGLAGATIAMVGQNLGAGRPARAARAVTLIAAAATGLSAVLLGLLTVFARPALALFTGDPQILALGAGAMGMLALYRTLMTLGMVMDGGLTGAGDTVSPMVINIIALWMVQLPAAWFLSTHLGWRADGIWWALVIGMAVQALLLVGRFRQGRWQAVRI
ncbi:MAG: MATE family efflux transporter [Anaerolineae bacterium]